MDFIEILKIVGPILGGGAGVGLISGYYSYISNRPKTLAEAQKINSEVVVTFAEGWQKYSENLEKRLNENERRTAEIQRLMLDQEAVYEEMIKHKDIEIADLQDKLREQEIRINDLQKEVNLCKSAGKIASEEVHTQMHEDLNTGIDKIGDSRK